TQIAAMKPAAPPPTTAISHARLFTCAFASTPPTNDTSSAWKSCIRRRATLWPRPSSQKMHFQLTRRAVAVLLSLFAFLTSAEAVVVSRDGLWTDIREEEIASRGAGQRLLFPKR